VTPRHLPDRRRRLAALAATGLFLAACGAEGDAGDDLLTDDAATDEADEADEVDDDAGAEDADGAAADDAEVTLAVADSPLGDHLVDGEGNTLYLFTDDSDGTSTCTDGCLEAWPALTVEGDPDWGEGVDGDLVDTIEREDDGSTQVTYDGMPLYTFASDEAPGDVDGQASGDVWYVVAPDGSAITDELEDDDEDSGSGY